MSKGQEPRRVFAVLGTAVFLLVVPGTVVGLVPWWISRWHVQAPFFGFTPFHVIGALLIAAGIPVLLESFGRFRATGRWHARSHLSDPIPRGKRILPLRAQSNVYRGCVRDSWSSFAAW